MVLILIKNAPLFSPRITPPSKKIVRVIVAPAVTNKTKAKGREVADTFAVSRE